MPQPVSVGARQKLFRAAPRLFSANGLILSATDPQLRGSAAQDESRVRSQPESVFTPRKYDRSSELAGPRSKALNFAQRSFVAFEILALAAADIVRFLVAGL
jgi:hypothetical protein